jgi:hypothetical protein
MSIVSILFYLVICDNLSLIDESRFWVKIYLRSAIPLYSSMVAWATDLLCGGVSHLVSYCISFISMGMCSCLVLFGFICLLQTWVLNTTQCLKSILSHLLSHKHAFLANTWYVQNVSIFLNTFAVVSPLICVFWIQLTRTNAIFSRITLVSCFCAEIQLSGKIPENTAKILFYEKTHGARIRDGEGPRGAHTPSGAGQARPRQGVVRPPRPSPRPLLPPTYTSWPKTMGGSTFFLDRVPMCCHHQKPWFGTRNSVLAPCRDRDLEEIFIIITDVSPSTIHDSPIHVWVIPIVGEGDGRDWMRLFM